MDARPIIVLGQTAFEVGGVSVLIIGALIALVRALAELIDRQSAAKIYTAFRQNLARSILLGLELLVAADIIRSVAVDPTFESVGVLALLVLVRTFLSWSLEVEIAGTWPWQRAPRTGSGVDSTNGA
jgi:uncharacterized membrane protein